MAAADLFKRTLDAGTTLVGVTRERAEAIVKEWVDSGDLRKAKAQKAIDDVMLRSRKVTDDLREMIRKEIREQVTTLGFATKDDIARLEQKLSAGAAQPEPAPTLGRMSGAPDGAPIQKASVKNPPARKPATAKAVPAKNVPAKKVPARKAAPVTKGAPSGPTERGARVKRGGA